MKSKCDRCGKQFGNVLESIDHAQNFRHTYKQMDLAKKAALVARGESHFSTFLVGYGTAPKLDRPIVIERFNVNDWVPGLPEPNWVG